MGITYKILVGGDQKKIDKVLERYKFKTKWEHSTLIVSKENHDRIMDILDDNGFTLYD